MSDTAAPETDAPAFEAEYQQWEIEREQQRQLIENKYTVEGARRVCETFALDHNVRFTDNGQCGFGRPCVGFLDANSMWIQYNPLDFDSYCDNKDPKRSYDDFLIVHSGEVSAPEGVEAYHKSDFLCVLKTECDTNLVKYLGTVINAISGNEEGAKKAQAEPDVEVPEESTNRAIKQMAFWIETLAERGDISIVHYLNGNTGLEAAFNGTENHAIVVTPRAA